METVSEIIDLLGGTVNVAKELGIPPQTVSSWKASNKIPIWRMEGIQQLAERHSKTLPAMPEGRAA